MLDEKHHMHRLERRHTQLVELGKRRSCRFRHDRGRNIFDIPEHQTPKVYRFHLTLRIEIYVRQCSTFVLNCRVTWPPRSEEHTSELQSLMRISYAVFCLKKKKT